MLVVGLWGNSGKFVKGASGFAITLVIGVCVVYNDLTSSVFCHISFVSSGRGQTVTDARVPSEWVEWFDVSKFTTVYL
jgi:hypothetical protein